MYNHRINRDRPVFYSDFREERQRKNGTDPFFIQIFANSGSEKMGLTPFFHIFRNSAMNGWLTASVSCRVFSRTTPRPISSREIEAIAFRFTIVER
jgi:hypothetical protein